MDDRIAMGKVPIALHSQFSSVPTFNGLNFSQWSEQIQFYLGLMDFDLSLREDKSNAITNISIEEHKVRYRNWERSNRLSLMYMRMNIAGNIKSTLPKTESAKEMLKIVEERSQTADKSLAGTLMSTLTTMKFDGSRIHYDPNYKSE
ncbi:PREDICTED: uncharacterized protein LOC109357953 [Lupinus angustifolius]|uniref:uncharacterized protein LOC109357953 n=1 Tax=Lupinus angustifolius TaxID=3871 RepID=UPI00092E53CE|nr:PREDICTED: uncharacterized protein LOC109357953 [Lupinus angustifolius]